MVDFSRFNSLVELANFYHDEAKCRRAVVESRWGVGDSQDVVCPYCGAHHCYTRKDGNFHCKHCDRVFSCKVGTIFENSKVSLFKWFSVMYLLTSHKKGVSSCQLARDIKVTQKTAWYMLQKIRYLFSQDDREKLSGVVECDEVYIGSRNKWKHFSKRQPHTQGKSVKTKTPIFGMIERTMIINDKGKPETMSVVRAMVVENCSERNLLPLINDSLKRIVLFSQMRLFLITMWHGMTTDTSNVTTRLFSTFVRVEFIQTTLKAFGHISEE